jgi:ribosomal protein S18 acetylase RimI-like enzyme
MTTLSRSDAAAAARDGLRPVNLRTDLAPLADLIELVFAASMDQGGAAAVREMRALSRMGPGLSVMPGASDLLQGISLGFVWIAGGRLVGNVSVYPANWPRALGSAWIIANVGVHPDYRGRGIAAQLMRAALDLIRQRGGTAAVLQVDADNDTARRLYQRLGFRDERGFTVWRRPGSARPPQHSGPSVFIAPRRPAEWRAEYALAQRVRPAERGGLGWQRPLHADLFHPPLLRRALDWLNLRAVERLVIRSEDQSRLLASLWIESAALVSSIQLTLLVDPADVEAYGAALLHLAARRFGDRRGALLIEHPTDDLATTEALRGCLFHPQRQVVHMRWDVPTDRP